MGSLVWLLLTGFDQIAIDMPLRLAEITSSARVQFPSISNSPISFSATWEDKVGTQLPFHECFHLTTGLLGVHVD
jgi:hypothetical protein